MRFFELTRRSEEAALFALRLLDLLPNDDEAQMQVARAVLQEDFHIQEGPGKRSHQRLRKAADAKRLVSIAEAPTEQADSQFRRGFDLQIYLKTSITGRGALRSQWSA